jgi:hypothetical protein
VKVTEEAVSKYGNKIKSAAARRRRVLIMKLIFLRRQDVLGSERIIVVKLPTRPQGWIHQYK